LRRKIKAVIYLVLGSTKPYLATLKKITVKIKFLAIIVLATMVVACNGESNYSIQGKAEGFDDDTSVYLNKIAEGNTLQVVDTAKISNGAFTFESRPLEEEDIALLTFENTRGNVVLVLEDENINIKAYKDSLNKSTVRGGESNKIFSSYISTMVAQNTELNKLQMEGMEAMRSGNQEKMEEARNEIDAIRKAGATHSLETVENNKNSFVSVLILTDLVGQQLVEPDKAQEIFDSMPKEIQETSRGQNLNKLIASIKEQQNAAKQAEVGNQAPDFTGPTPQGEELALSDAMGKYTIIDFWASWCKPCRAENPNVVKVYNKYHDKGLNIVSVSLDRPDARDRWLKAIENDNMTWYHVSNLEEWQDPIARAYGVRAIPATFLLDENGTIIDKDLRGEDLENKIAELLGEEIPQDNATASS
tara:strand:+ start:6953 stop:8206 length:1254 start_codon:yes stop_codon:yes gene_type:complete